MAATKRTDKQIEEDKVIIAKYLVQAKSVRNICDLLNADNERNGKGYTLAYSMIAYDIKKILNEWRDERKDLIDLVVDRELKKLDIIEQECWVAWEKSKLDKKNTKVVGGIVTEEGKMKGGKIKERSYEGSYGDVRIFDKILICMDRRKELLGYAAPKKVEFSGSIGVGMAQMDEEEMAKERMRVIRNIKKSS